MNGPPIPSIPETYEPIKPIKKMVIIYPISKINSLSKKHF